LSAKKKGKKKKQAGEGSVLTEPICPVCGADLDPGKGVCDRCGTTYRMAGDGEQPSEPPEEGSAPKEEPKLKAGDGPEEQPSEGKKEKKKDGELPKEAPEEEPLEGKEEKKEGDKGEPVAGEEATHPPKEGDKPAIIEKFSKIEGLDEEKAQQLLGTGYTSVEVLKRAEIQDLAKLKGFDKELARKVLESIGADSVKGKKEEKGAGEGEEPSKPEKKLKSGDGKEDEDAPSLEKWLAGEEDENALEAWLSEGEEKPGKKPKAGKKKPAKPEREKPAKKKPRDKLKEKKEFESTGDEDMDVLKKWLTGEEDALEAWLSEEPGAAKKKPAGGEVETSKISDELMAKDRLLQEREEELAEREKEMEALRTEMEDFKARMNKALEQIDTGAFDPLNVLEDSANLQRQLEAETKKRQALEKEIEHVKKGSIAVIKYVKAQQVRAQSPAVQTLQKKLAADAEALRKAETEIKARDEQLRVLKEQLDGKLEELPADVQELKKKELELKELEAKIKATEEGLTKEKEAIKAGAVGADVSGAADIELQQRFQEELREKESAFDQERQAFRQEISELKKQVETIELEKKQAEERAELAGKDSGTINKEIDLKIQSLENKEKMLLLREEEIGELKQQLAFKDEEITKLKEPIKFKEQEMLRREEDLLYREQRLIAEMRKMEEAKKSIGSLDQQEAKKQLESLKQEIARKEEEIRAKDTYLKSKEEELRLREQGLIGEEIEAREEDRKLEISIRKVKSGTSRLDDLLYGGIPFGANVSMYGPAYVGKEVLVGVFIAEGLKKGIPAIFVLTDKTPEQIREEMMFIVSGYEEYEKLGIVKYVDAYSVSMGEEKNDTNTIYVDEPTDTDSILKAVDEISNKYKEENHEYYRLAFRSISTLIAYLDPSQVFRFLQPFAGRRKRDKAVSMYIIEKGMHQESDIQMLGHIMDGTIDFKVEQLKTFLAIQGICDVQSRAYVRYTHSKQGLNIGSFSLDHIR